MNELWYAVRQALEGPPADPPPARQRPTITVLETPARQIAAVGTTLATLTSRVGDFRTPSSRRTVMSDIKHDVKKGIDNTADAAKKATEKTVDATKKAGQAIGDKAKEAGQKIKDASK